MVSIPGDEVFLRRPFGIAGLREGQVDIFYKVVGRGTRALSNAKVDAAIDVLGPCGNGFKIPSEIKAAVLVAGGYGIAPLCGLAKRLRGIDIHLYCGGKSQGDLFLVDEFTSAGAVVKLATEDGTAGERGMVTDLFERDLDSLKGCAIFACGPEGLLKKVAALSIINNIPAQISMEAYMACGIGVCQGCVCEDSSGEYVRVCREGPVFYANELKWT